jgi:hypothetical protein
MDRIIATNSVAIGAADTAPVSGTPQYATAGNPATSTPATNFPAYQYNALQEELIAVIAAAGIAPDRTNNAQLLAAIKKLGQAASGNYAADSGTANALVVTLSPAPASLASLVGVPIRIKKSAATNTAAVTLAVNGLAATAIVSSNGIALSAGTLPASGIFTVIFDGTWFQLVSANRNWQGAIASGVTTALPDNTWTTIPLGAPSIDTDGFWSGGTPSRLTVPAGISSVRCLGTVSVGTGATGTLQYRVLKNGVAASLFQTPLTPSNTLLEPFLTTRLLCAVGDYFELQELQVSGGPLSTDTNLRFSIEVIQ